MQIIFNKNIETENKAEIEKYLNPYLFLIPNWCQKITINTVDSENHGDVAGMRSRFEYREVCIDVYGYWFLQSDWEKQDAIIHELCHLHNYQVYHFAESVIETFVKCEDSRSVLQKELTKHLEGGTQDLCYAIQSKFNANEK